MIKIYTYKILQPEELEQIKHNLKEIITDSNHYVYDGFHYFSHDLTYIKVQYKHLYFVAFNNDKIIGVLKYSKKAYYPDHVWSISWIDVHKDYRQQGIAKNLFKTLNNWITKDYIIILTQMSRMGRKINIDQIVKNIIMNCEVFIDEEEYAKKYNNNITA